MEQRVWLFVEQALAVVTRRESLSEPVWQTRRAPTVQVENRHVTKVVGHAMPLERRPASDVQRLDLARQNCQDLMERGWIVRPTEHTPRKPCQPACTHVVDGEVG